MIKAMAGLVPCFAGQVRLRRTDRCDRACFSCIWCGNGLGFVPQTENIFTRLTILENLQIAAQLAAKNRTLCKQRIAAMLDMFPGPWSAGPANWPAHSRAGSARCWPQRAPC
jgi:branched-chain amino acid transport system ATP-binding protein